MTLKTCEREKDKKILGQKRIQTVHQYFYQSESLLHPLSTLSKKKKNQEHITTTHSQHRKL